MNRGQQEREDLEKQRISNIDKVEAEMEEVEAEMEEMEEVEAEEMAGVEEKDNNVKIKVNRVDVNKI